MRIRFQEREGRPRRMGGGSLVAVGMIAAVAVGPAYAAVPGRLGGYGSSGVPGSGSGAGFGVGAARGVPFHSAAGAVGWNFSPSLTLREIYNDNIALAVPGRERSDFVTEVEPGISISKQTRRFDLLANYRMQNLFYARNSASDAIFHQLFSRMNADLWPGTFALGARATASQSLISPDQPVPLSNVSITGNRTDVVTYSVTPRLQHAFGRMAIVKAHYAYSVVDYNTRQLSGSQTGEVGASLGTGPDVTGIAISLKYNRSRTNFDASPDVIFERLIGVARYPAQYRFRLVLRGGYEDNNFQFGSAAAQPKGKIWSGGFEWNITPHSYLEAGYGRRFFGRTVNASFRHEGGWTTVSLNFTEEPTTISRLTLEEQPLVLGPNGQFIQVLAPSLPTLSAQVFINRRLSGTLSARGARDRVAATISRSERTFEITGSKETVTGVDASWYRNLGARTSGDIAGYWQRRRFIGGFRVDDLWEVRGGLQYRFGVHASGSLSVMHTQRTSNAAADYSVNMVALGITLGF